MQRHVSPRLSGPAALAAVTRDTACGSMSDVMIPGVRRRSQAESPTATGNRDLMRIARPLTPTERMTSPGSAGGRKDGFETDGLASNIAAPLKPGP